MIKAVARSYLKRVPGARVVMLEHDPAEVEALVLAPEDEGPAPLDELTQEEKEAEARRLKLLKWLVPKKGIARDRLEAAKSAAAKEEALRNAPRRVSDKVLALGRDVRPVQWFLKGQAKEAGAAVLVEAVGGGRESGADMGHGHPRLLRADAVAAIAAALESVEPPSDVALVDGVLRLFAFYRDAADAGDGVLYFVV